MAWLPAIASRGCGPGQQMRLAAAFAEWLMGLPPGWVTAVPGLSRTGQLRLIGNGVVPRQGAVALQLLIQIAAAPAPSLAGPPCQGAPRERPQPGACGRPQAPPAGGMPGQRQRGQAALGACPRDRGRAAIRAAAAPAPCRRR
jgi:hypothetical protein